MSAVWMVLSISEDSGVEDSDDDSDEGDLHTSVGLSVTNSEFAGFFSGEFKLSILPPALFTVLAGERFRFSQAYLESLILATDAGLTVSTLDVFGVDVFELFKVIKTDVCKADDKFGVGGNDEKTSENAPASIGPPERKKEFS